LSGLSTDTGLAKEQVHQVLNVLMTKGYVAQKERDKGPRWYVTTEGRKIVIDTLTV
jgi:DNA-binding IclR family transcriptional regulator